VPYPKLLGLARRRPLLATPRISIVATILATAVIPVAARSQAGPDGIVLVVNSGNPVTALHREQIEGVFLGRVFHWPGTGYDVLPVDQVDNAPARAIFTRDVLRKSRDAIKGYWQNQIFSGRATPPPARVSDADVLTYVRTNTGAIGYVQVGTELGEGVKAISIAP
jgi:ABC-type phosphate transport system substrate-binding protein